MSDSFVKQEVFDTFVNSVSDKFAQLDSINNQTISRHETFLKLTLPEGKVPNYDSFVEGLSKYDAFVRALRDIRSMPKMSERITAALKHNEANPEAFPIMADDINVLEQASQAESISRSNYDLSLELPHTKLYKDRLQVFLGSSQ